MGEALMFRAGGGSGFNNNGSGDFGNYQLITQFVDSNQTFVMPTGVKNNEIHVRIFGGGGGSKSSAGGGSGWMNNGFLQIDPGSQIPITIGTGGTASYMSSTSGGITSFGTYLSANGGETATNNSGANGGSGGGGSGDGANGGTGYQFGGGGSAGGYRNGGSGGQWGGNGSKTGWAQNGINTISLISEDDVYNADGIGYGRGGYSDYENAGAGGGGYGANGGNGLSDTWWGQANGGGGGGGYGSAGYGGSAGSNRGNTSVSAFGGGGGGYGPGGGKNTTPSRGGGAGGRNTNGANGVCIIQYYRLTE